MSIGFRSPLLGLALVSMAGCSRVDDLWARAQASVAGDAETGSDASSPTPSAHAHAQGHAPLTVRGAHAPVPPGTPTPTVAEESDGGTPPVPPTPVDGGVAAAPAPPAGPWMTAMWIWVPIYEQMDARGPRVGYLRAGARVHVDPVSTGTAGCSHGWYQVQGSGGFICLSRMTSLDEAGLGTRTPVQPDLEAAMPYHYMVSGRAAVMYRWLPSTADMREVEPERFGIVTAPAQPATPDDGGAPTPGIPTDNAAVLSTGTPTTTAPTEGADASAPSRAQIAAGIQNRAQAEDAGVRIEDLAGEAGRPLLRRMLAGMYISVDREMTSAGRTFWRTENGGYVERNAVSNLHEPPTFQGVTLDEQHPLPLAFMVSYRGFTYTLSPDGHTATRQAPAPRLTAYSLTADPPVQVGRLQFYRTREGQYLNFNQIRLVQTVAPPATVGPTEKWIEVNLDRQTLVAYEGPRPVYVTLVSTGRRNQTDPTRNYETIQGEFRIQSKHIATTMDGNSAGDGPYSIEDVPWVMYFENSFALHGAFWHSGFGAMHSHGCVNMAPADAHWVFRWSEPALPAGWHGVYTTAEHPGTRVFVHYEHQALGERGGPTIVPQH